MFLCASTSDCRELDCTHSLFAGSVLETGISVLGGDPERQERESGKTETTGNVGVLLVAPFHSCFELCSLLSRHVGQH